MKEFKAQCVHSDTGLCETCFSYESRLSKAEQERDEALKQLHGEAYAIADLESKLRKVNKELEMMKKVSNAPCGHLDQYCYSLDGKGSQIRCYVCDLRKAEDLLHQCGQQKEIYRQETIRWKEAYEPLNEKHKKAEAVVAAAKKLKERWDRFPDVEYTSSYQIISSALASYEGKEGL